MLNKIKSTKLKKFLKLAADILNKYPERYFIYRDTLDDLYIYCFISESDYFNACAILRAWKIKEV